MATEPDGGHNPVDLRVPLSRLALSTLRCMLFLAESYLAAGASVAEFAGQARAAATASAAEQATRSASVKAIFVPSGRDVLRPLPGAVGGAVWQPRAALAGLEFDRVSLAVAVVQAR